MRALPIFLAAPLLATFAPPALQRGRPPMEQPMLVFEPVALDPEHPAARRVGGLRYLEGWSIRSDDARFGGISAIHVENGDVTATSDAGSLIRFRLPARGRRTSASIRAIAQGSADDKRARDAEAMAVHEGTAWVAFERSNSVWRFERRSWRFEAKAAPTAMRGWPANSGAEAIVRLRDGRFLVFAEGRSNATGPTSAMLFDGDPAVAGTRAVRFTYDRPEGFRVTDAAQLPDGRLLLLNRRFTLLGGIAAKLTLADPAGIAEGTILRAREIARLAPPATVDNMEGLSVGREGGRTIVWIASDNNFMPVQRTLLLKFALLE